MRTKVIDHINKFRLICNSKGYITKGELKDYLGCGAPKAQEVWLDLINEISQEGKMVDPLGIEPSRVMKRLNLNEKKIKEYAEMGL